MLHRILAALVIANLSSSGLAAEVKICAVEWPPFVNVEKKQIVGGLTVEILSAAFDKAGHKLRIELRPYIRCLVEVKERKFDGMSDVAPRPGYLPSQMPVSVWTNSIWVREDSALKTFDGLDSFKDKTVGFVRGYSYVPKVKAYKGWKKDWTQTDELNITKLANGRIEYIVADILSTQLYIQKHGYKIRALEPPIESQLEHVLFHEGKGALVKEFDAALKALVDDGTVDALYKKELHMKFTDMLKAAGKN